MPTGGCECAASPTRKADPRLKDDETKWFIL